MRNVPRISSPPRDTEPDLTARASFIPVYDLYGDPQRRNAPGFVHAERVRVRAPLHDWSIATHQHTDLFQAFLITEQGGNLRVEERRIAFEAPWVVWIPAGTVHGFDFRPGTDGYVVSIAADFLNRSLARETSQSLRGIVDHLIESALPADDQKICVIERHFSGLLDEIERAEAGTEAAVAAYLDLIFVTMARIGAASSNPLQHDRPASVFRQFRGLVEKHFREHWSIAAYADAIGVTRDQLHDICRRAAGRPAIDIIHDRLIIEAKRALTYTAFGVSEIAFDLGFRDPAYFSRFFSRRAGCSPLAFRRMPPTRLA